MMTTSLASFAPSLAFESPRELPSRLMPFVGIALRALDIVALAITGYLGFVAASPTTAFLLQSDHAATLLIAVVFLPFVLDQANAYRAERLHRPGHLFGSAAIGVAMLFGALLAVGLATDTVDQDAVAWLAVWFVLAIGAMSTVRGVFWVQSQRLIASGRVRETIAVVGNDAETFRLAGILGRQSEQAIEIVGVFSATPGAADRRFAGTLADLVKLGQSRPIDKIVVAAPISGQPQVQRVIHTLKSLAVDILLAPHGSAGEPIIRSVDRVAGIPVIRLVAASPALAVAKAA